MISILSVVSTDGWFQGKWKVPTNSYTNIQPKLLCLKNCFQKRCIILKNRSSAILIPKKLHLKFVRMKLLNRRNESRKLIKNISNESFVVQQKYSSSHLWDWWEDFPGNLVVEVKIFCNLCILFIVLQNKKNSLCRKWNDSLPQK